MAHPVHSSKTWPEPDGEAAAFPAGADRISLRILALVAVGLASIAATLLTLADLGAV